MLTPLQKRLLIGLLVLVFAGACFAEWRSSIDSPHHQAIGQSDKGTKGHAPQLTIPESAEDRIADYTWWLGAFTGALVIVSAFQITFLISADKTARITAKAAADTVETMERNARRQLRAYLGVRSGHIIRQRENLYLLEIGISNSGQTPARHVRHAITAAKQLNAEARINFIAPPERNQEWPLVPQAVWTLRHDIPITPAEEVEMDAGRMTIFAWGTVRYDDIFGEGQTVHFRYQHGRRKNFEARHGVIPGWEIDPAGEGNSST